MLGPWGRVYRSCARLALQLIISTGGIALVAEEVCHERLSEHQWPSFNTDFCLRCLFDAARIASQVKQLIAHKIGSWLFLFQILVGVSTGSKE